jgi:predicted thioesterase
LTEVDGAKLTFEVEGFDEKDKIGEATHQRFIINAEKFNSRVAKKAGT